MLDLAEITLLYHMVKQHYQNVLALNAIITNNSLFNMQISIYPDSGKFKWVITPYLNLISYVVIKIQVTYYHVNTELCWMLSRRSRVFNVYSHETKRARWIRCVLSISQIIKTVVSVSVWSKIVFMQFTLRGSVC